MERKDAGLILLVGAALVNRQHRRSRTRALRLALVMDMVTSPACLNAAVGGVGGGIIQEHGIDLTPLPLPDISIPSVIFVWSSGTAFGL